MKKVLLALLFIASLSLGGKFLLDQIQPAKQEKSATKFSVTEEKAMVVIIASYNNSDWCERNLRSVFEQKYRNYRVIYIDDASTDDTLQKAQEFVKRSGEEERVQFIHNEKNRGAAENYYRAIHSCRTDEVAVIVDGDDWFLHEWALQRLNEEYADPSVWMTYGSYLYYPSYKKGECSKAIPKEVLEKQQLRPYLQKRGFLLSHLKTFYAGFFKKVKLEDLLFEGAFMGGSWDAAAMVPLLEMAGSEHSRLIKDPLYANNRANALNDDKVNFAKKLACWEKVQQSSPYESLSSFGREEPLAADCILFSFDRPKELLGFIESMEKRCSNFDAIHVIYRASSDAMKEAYDEISERFAEVNFVNLENTKGFKFLLLKTLYHTPSDFVFFAHDTAAMSEELDFSALIQRLQQTGAFGFYLAKETAAQLATQEEKERPLSLISFDQGVVAWQWNQVADKRKTFPAFERALYKKEEILKSLETLHYEDIKQLEEQWCEVGKATKVGLCYKKGKEPPPDQERMLPTEEP